MPVILVLVGAQRVNTITKHNLWVEYDGSLFQHIGLYSSLKGKIQTLKDKQFGEVPAFVPHRNPAARVHTNIVTFGNHTIEQAYAGRSYFWGIYPKTSDLVSIVFNRPFALRRYLFRSGSAEYLSDRLYNANVEVLPDTALVSDDGKELLLHRAKPPEHSTSDTLMSMATGITMSNTSMVTWAGYRSTVDGFLIVAAFDELGLAKGVLDARVGRVREVRLRIHGDNKNWVILSEVCVSVESTSILVFLDRATCYFSVQIWLQHRHSLSDRRSLGQG